MRIPVSLFSLFLPALGLASTHDLKLGVNMFELLAQDVRYTSGSLASLPACQSLIANPRITIDNSILPAPSQGALLFSQLFVPRGLSVELLNQSARALATHGTTIAIAADNSKLLIFASPQDRTPRELNFRSQVNSLTFSDNGLVLAAQTKSGDVGVFDLESSDPHPAAVISGCPSGKKPVLSQDGSLLFVATCENGLRVYHTQIAHSVVTARGKFLLPNLPPSESGFLLAPFTGAHSPIVVSYSRARELNVFTRDLGNDPRLIASLPTLGHVTLGAVMPKGKDFVVCQKARSSSVDDQDWYETALYRWKERGNVYHRLPLSGTQGVNHDVTALHFMPERNLVWGAMGNKLMGWNLQTGTASYTLRLPIRIREHGGGVFSEVAHLLSFPDDRNTLFIQMDDGAIYRIALNAF